MSKFTSGFIMFVVGLILLLAGVGDPVTHTWLNYVYEGSLIILGLVLCVFGARNLRHSED